MPTAQRTSVQQLTTTEAAVLALLAIEGERSGYDLLRAVTRAIGHIWSRLRGAVSTQRCHGSSSSVSRIERRPVAQATRPDKHVYRISREGRAGHHGLARTVEARGAPTPFSRSSSAA